MKAYAWIAAALACAACGDRSAEPAVNNAAEPPAAPAAPIQPGLYRQATTLLELKDPSLSPSEAAAAAKAIGTTQSEDRCVTPDMVEDPKALIKSDVSEGCTMQKSVWDDGKIDIALSCPPTSASGGANLALTGDYDSDRYTIAMTMKGASGESMRMTVDARRLGDCPA